VENDNNDITLLKPEYFQICTMHQGHLLIGGSEGETLSKIKGYLAAEKKRVSSSRCKNGQEFEKYNPHVDLISGWQVTAILRKNIQIKFYFF